MYTLRSEGTFSLVFNDHSNLFHERFERNPSHSSPCCACRSCTSLYTYRVPAHPNLLYGLRQSKLLQRSVYGVERYLSRLPAYGMERYLLRQVVYGAKHGCCEVNSYSRERSACNGSARRRHKCGSSSSCCCCRVSDGGSEIDYGVGVDEADDVLSLLSEGMSEGCDGFRRRYGSPYERLEAETGKNDGGRKRKVGSDAKVQEQKEVDIVSELNEVKRKLAELESDMKRHQTVRTTARRKKDGEGNNLAKRENHKAGDVSIRSSNYSVSSLGDFSSNAEIEDKYTQIDEELSIQHEKDKGRDGRVMGKVIEESTRLRDYSKRLGESSYQKNIKVQDDVSLNLKKYREHKIASTQEIQSRAGSTQKNMDVLRSHEIAGQSFPISRKEFNSQENISSVSMNLNDTRGRNYGDNQVMEASALPRLRTTETHRSHAGYVNMPTRLKGTYHSRNLDEGSMSQDTNSTSSFKSFIEMRDNKCQTDENITNFGAQYVAQPTKVSSSGKIAFEEVSDLQGSFRSSAEVRMKQIKREESDRRSIQEMVMRPSLIPARAFAPAEPTTRIRSSDVCSETLEGSSPALSMHSGRTTAFQSEMDSGDDSGRTYHDPLNTITTEDSLGSTDRLEKFSSQYINECVEIVGSEKQSAIEAGSCGASEFKGPSAMMRDVRQPSVHSSQRSTRGYAQGAPTTIMSSLEGNTGTSENSSSVMCIYSGSTTAFHSGTSGGGECHQTYHNPFGTANPEDSLGSAGHFAQLSSQSIEEFAENVRREDMISETQREKKGSELPFVEVDKRREPSNTINPEDSLGSADGLEKLSSQFVGEFVDKVKHEVTIAETQGEIEGLELQSAIEVGTYWKNRSSQRDSQDGIQFELASSLSSGGSGTEGLSVLIEDVRETYVPSSEQPARGSSQSVPTTIITSPEVSLDISKSSCSALVKHPGRTTALQLETHSADESSQTFLEPLNTISSDALGSNARLEKSSSQFIDEFLDKAKREVMISRTQGETKGRELHASEIGKSQRNSKNQYDIQEGSQSELASSRSSGVSGLKGPSDVMWDVREPSVQDISKAEEPLVTSPNEKAVVRRSGRAFWSIIGDVFRLRWGSHADDHNLTGRSGEISSPDKFASTEASSSGNEHEENIKNSVTSEKAVPPYSSTSVSDQLQEREKFSLSDGKVYETVGSKELKPPGKVTLSLTEKGKSSDSFSTNKEILELSSPLQMSAVVEETKVVGSSELSKLKSMEHTGQSISLPATKLPGAREKEVELKRRILQRTKQVAKDRFDDWEEAYKLEREQKIVDEMFMREALLEAKKAADAWEVPVGAVLVQHGKIISRGCNLVEELRDSTAHAEMICIREASNILRSWRLSETTLYVTLEPCPMCAGAILGARIDAVVWGAPNKLLGADGSWVRLFSDEGDGSESRDKPSAPTHPFHPKMKIRRGVLASECADMMQQFFQLRRKKKKAEPSFPQSSLPGSHNPAKLLTKMHDIFHFVFCL